MTLTELTKLHARHGIMHIGPSGFSIHAARNTKYQRNGPREYAKCIRKFRISGTGRTPFFFDHERQIVCRRTKTGGKAQFQNHKEENMEAEVNQQAEEGIAVVQAEDIQNDTEYACPVTIGSPGVTLTLDFDTGSSDLWVWSSEVRASQAEIQGHRIYNPHRSHSSKKIHGEVWEIRYGDGSTASGDVHLDTVIIGDIKIRNQAVEVAKRLSEELLTGGSDGIFGLAFPKLNTVKPHRQKTPIESMMDQGLLKEPIFSVKLDRHDSRGFYTFGYIDNQVHASKLYWQDVTPDNGWWEVPSPYIKIGSTIYDRGSDNTAIIDTGTTLILLDNDSVDRLYAEVPGARLDHNVGGYIFPTNAHIPPLAFSVGDYLFTVPKEELAFSDAGNGMSYGAVQYRGQNDQDILGDVFLKHVYVVFDQGEQPKIGVAQRS